MSFHPLHHSIVSVTKKALCSFVFDFKSHGNNRIVVCPDQAFTFDCRKSLKYEKIALLMTTSNFLAILREGDISGICLERDLKTILNTFGYGEKVIAKAKNKENVVEIKVVLKI